MADIPQETQLAQALRDGLNALSVPRASPNFDSHVLAALRAPQPWWHRLWQPAKPLLLGASCSLSVMFLALYWTLSAPIFPTPPLLGIGEQASTQRPAPSLDALLNRSDLSAGSLAMWAARPPAAPSEDRRPEPRRKAQLLRHPALIV